METDHQAKIRRANLFRWLTDKSLTKSDLARRLGKTRGYITNLQTRHFGERAARSIEEALFLPRGFLDLA